MSLLKSALKLAEQGFFIFPLKPMSKLPLDEGWQGSSSRDKDKIKRWWTDPIFDREQPWNIGINTSRFGKDEHLLVIDVDVVKSDGWESILKFELEGKHFPETFTQSTPSGGSHLVYRTKKKFSNSVKKLAAGIDIRAFGGLVVGTGSELPGGVYTSNSTSVNSAPGWIDADLAQASLRPKANTLSPIPGVNKDYAEARAVHFLKVDAKIAEAGERNQVAFQTAAYLMSIGVDPFPAYELMCELWNPRLSSPLDEDELLTTIENAYRYGTGAKGANSPEADFLPVIGLQETTEVRSTPMDDLNRKFAFMLNGGSHHILYQTTNEHGEVKFMHVKEESFHKKFASKFFVDGNGKSRPLTKAWMESEKRRSYEGICFMPGKVAPPQFFNLWQGFRVKPLSAEQVSDEARASVDMFHEHLFENVCDRSTSLSNWLKGYFAHLIQKPAERPDVALVFRGEQGVGKNTVVERIGHLIGPHSMLVTNPRFLTSNFNAHLENKIMITFSEAFWTGNKVAEGALKELITGSQHVIERKYCETYTVDNCLRVFILGNENWLVPAGKHERRFAFFDVGNKRRQDRAFFRRMREGMEAGGYSLLLHQLLNHDFSGIDVGQNPRTKGLRDQQGHTNSILEKFIDACLEEGEILYSGIHGWPEKISKHTFAEAFVDYAKRVNWRNNLPDRSAIGRFIADNLPCVKRNGKMTDGEDRVNCFDLPALDVMKKEWAKVFNHEV